MKLWCMNHIKLHFAPLHYQAMFLYLVCVGNIDYYVFKLPIHLLLLLKYYGVVPGTSRLALVRALGDLYELPHMEVNVGEGHHWTGRSPAPLPPGMGAARINV